MRDAVRRAAEVCPIEVGVAVAGGDWKLTVVSKLDESEAPLRFGALRAAVGPVSAKTLTRQLRTLEEDGIVTRTVFAEVPPRVEYALTDQGRGLARVADAMSAWSAEYLRTRA